MNSLTNTSRKGAAPDEADYSTRGFYEPGFIHLHIATREDLNDFNALAANEATAGWVATFLHEYVHFLQDITSTHGLVNFITAVQYLKNANKKVTEGAAREFGTPLRLDNTFNLSTNITLRKLYFGNGAPVANIKYLGHFVENTEVATNSGKLSVPKYHICYYDKGAQQNMTRHFGSVHLKEYMAFAIQKQFAPDTSNSDIPYALVEFLIRDEYPPLAADISLIIALCDAALMCYHPAEMFFRTLTRMKEMRWNPSGVDSVYAFAFDGVKFGSQTQPESVNSLYQKTAASAVEEFRDALRGDIFKDNVIWFDEVVKEALELRQKYEGFFTRLVRSPGGFSPLFGEIFGRMGTPFMTNALFKGFFNPPTRLNTLKIYPYYPKVFQAICRTYEGKKDCILRTFCETRTDKNVTNEHCSTSPWERVNLPELCPYAQMWKSWGLTDKKPIIV